MHSSRKFQHGRPVKGLLHAQANAAEDEEPEDETTAAFRRAAEAVKEKREEEAMCVEHRIYKCAAAQAAALASPFPACSRAR